MILGVSIFNFKGFIVTGGTIIHMVVYRGYGEECNSTAVVSPESRFCPLIRSPEALHSVFHGLMHGGFRLSFCWVLGGGCFLGGSRSP
jgi:hypothetical protein